MDWGPETVSCQVKSSIHGEGIRRSINLMNMFLQSTVRVSVWAFDLI